jgi:hypothetical protein
MLFSITILYTEFDPLLPIIPLKLLPGKLPYIISLYKDEADGDLCNLATNSGTSLIEKA